MIKQIINYVKHVFCTIKNAFVKRTKVMVISTTITTTVLAVVIPKLISAFPAIFIIGTGPIWITYYITCVIFILYSMSYMINGKSND